MGEAEMAAEYYHLKNQENAIVERLQVLKDALSKTTGKRQAGAFLINVSSSNQERLDQEAARLLMEQAGIGVPVKVSPVVRLTVKPWVSLGVEIKGVA